MTAVFKQAVDVLHTHPAFMEVAIFTAPPAAGVAVVIYRGRHDPAVSLAGMETPVRSPGWSAHVRQAEVPTRPRVDVDTLTIGGTVYRIRDVEEDIERTEWRCDVIEA